MNDKLVKLRVTQLISWLGLLTLTMLTMMLFLLLNRLIVKQQLAVFDWRIVTAVFVIVVSTGNAIILYMKTEYYRDSIQKLSKHTQLQETDRWIYSRWYRFTVYCRLATLGLILLAGITIMIASMGLKQTNMESLDTAVTLVWVGVATIVFLVQLLYWLSTKKKLMRTIG